LKLIFMHGSGGCGDVWTHQKAHFAGAEAFDLPGHPQGDLCATVDLYVEWLRGRLRPVREKELVLVGHSLGGAIALLYALKYPGEVKGVITVGSGGRLRVSPVILDALEKIVQEPERFPEFFGPGLAGVDPDLRQTLFKGMVENGPAVMLNDFRACDGFDIMDRLGEIDVPALALCGSEDVMTPPKYSQFLGRSMPDCRVEIIPGGTHYLAAEMPLAVNRAIQQFLDLLSQTRAA
jgi:pimeloyl-ACP methyl ester carboxylesterase